MVIFVGEAHLQLDGGQSFQDRGTEVKQGGDTVVGCILQGEKGPLERWGTQIWRCGAAVFPAGPIHPTCPCLARTRLPVVICYSL